MRMSVLALPVLAALALAGCATPIGPVEVTRFHQPSALQQLGQGTITVEAAPGTDPKSLELASYRSAVSRELVRIGYTVVESGPAGQVALVRLDRSNFKPDAARSPVSVGVGGSTGSYGSGVGVGIGINLGGGGSRSQVVTRLGVMIQDKASSQTIWEGRASFAVGASAPLAQSSLAAPKMAAALFQEFPGNDGETVEVK